MNTIIIDHYNDGQLAISDKGDIMGTYGNNNEVLSGIIPSYVPVERFVHGKRWASGGVNTAGQMKNGLQSRGILIPPSSQRFGIHY